MPADFVGLLGAAAPVAPLLPPLTVMVSCLVALALVLLARQIVSAFFQVGESLVGWVPWLGGKAKKSLHVIEQRLVSYLSGVILGLEGQVASSWHSLARLSEDLARSTLHAAQAAGHVWWYVTSKYSLPAIVARLEWAALKQAGLAAKNHLTTTQIVRITKVITHPVAGPIGGAITAKAKPIRAEVARLSHIVLPRLEAIEGTLGHVIPQDIAELRARVRAGERRVGRLWDRIRANERKIVGIGAVAIVSTALAKLGGSWIRCNNWRKLGRAGCRMDSTLIDLLLLETVAIVGTISIEELARELVGITDEVADAVGAFIREA